MRNSLVYLAAAAALGATVNGRNLHSLPKATGSLAWPSDGISPKPTLPPFPQAELARRTTSSIMTALVAPDNTCGYISGVSTHLYTCQIEDKCGFFTSADGIPGALVCCDDETCGLRTTCIDYQAVSVSFLCDDSCWVRNLIPPNTTLQLDRLTLVARPIHTFSSVRTRTGNTVTLSPFPVTSRITGATRCQSRPPRLPRRHLMAKRTGGLSPRSL